MIVTVTKDYDQMSLEGARRIAALVRKKPDAVLGFATGSTPVGMYRELIRMHGEEGLDFSKVVTFNLDEYVGLSPEHPESYHRFMWENLFHHINVDPRFVYIPLGTAEDIPAFCEWYEERIRFHGGIDLQILGIGSNGHIAFNEPGSSLESRTRMMALTRKTRRDNQRFFDSLEDVPEHAITMGVGTIMDAKRLLVLASGSGKADAVKRMVEGPVKTNVPATYVQLHGNAALIVDRKAGAGLTGMHESTG